MAMKLWCNMWPSVFPRLSFKLGTKWRARCSFAQGLETRHSLAHSSTSRKCSSLNPYRKPLSSLASRAPKIQRFPEALSAPMPPQHQWELFPLHCVRFRHLSANKQWNSDEELWHVLRNIATWNQRPPWLSFCLTLTVWLEREKVQALAESEQEQVGFWPVLSSWLLEGIFTIGGWGQLIHDNLYEVDVVVGCQCFFCICLALPNLVLPEWQLLAGTFAPSTYVATYFPSLIYPLTFPLSHYGVVCAPYARSFPCVPWSCTSISPV